MAWKLERLSGEDNLTALFRLTIPDDSVSVTFTRQNLRKVFEGDLNFTPQRVGCVLRLMDKLYPLPKKAIRLEDRYSDIELKDYLQACGLYVFKDISGRVDVQIAIKIMEGRGYQIWGKINEKFYCSPELNFSRN